MRLLKNIFLHSALLLKTHQYTQFIEYMQLCFIRIVMPQTTHTTFQNLTVYCYSYAQLFSLYEDVFIRKEYAPYKISSAKTIIDGGAHIGMASLFFAQQFPNAHIIAFEPDPDTFALLKKNIIQNNLSSQIKPVNAALSSKKGKALFYFDASFPGSTISSLSKKRHFKTAKQVQTMPLSSFISKPIDIVKLDVEGAETVVLNDLLKHKKLHLLTNIYIEFHHNVSADNTLGPFLQSLEMNGFTYQLTTALQSPFDKNTFQDVLIYAFRK